MTYREVWETIPENKKEWIYLYIGKIIDGEYDAELQRLLKWHLTETQWKLFSLFCHEAASLSI